MFEQRIIGFLCNWCSYEAADAAGRARELYPASLRILRVPCAGRVDPLFVMEAFRAGADGVLILGCPPGLCHYKEGNYQAASRYALLTKLLTQLGIHGKRVKLEWVSAGDREKFSRVVSEMVEGVRQLGPLRRSG